MLAHIPFRPILLASGLSVILSPLVSAATLGDTDPSPRIKKGPGPKVNSSSPHSQRDGQNSRFTFYEAGQGACGGWNSGSDYIVALNDQQWDNGAHCWKMVTLSYGGQTTEAQIVDMCPGCPFGALDLTQGLFIHFAGLDVGEIYGDWWFVDEAPAPAPVSQPDPQPQPEWQWQPPQQEQEKSQPQVDSAPHAQGDNNANNNAYTSPMSASTSTTTSSPSPTNIPAPTPTHSRNPVAVLFNPVMNAASPASSNNITFADSTRTSALAKASMARATVPKPAADLGAGYFHSGGSATIRSLRWETFISILLCGLVLI
ncbi:uncharacterized protein FOMMEDRAFT_26766 [Fomitiporia mediterranea MF3/22]|uniref:uncharacterized protein n=1 Tax=Fomitiporia mediterranea (strain MF3/22) TaxID=694068 RepID=UPI0004407B8D|nr:uncharacterized protein FOMMEDRAFT_26766 [Fomitiporia mediterranea MF3/22]EJD05980.1 hypothetical protein FOMMEDRAFT_26766 [Fomitiporia mediterranea MF3/22]